MSRRRKSPLKTVLIGGGLLVFGAIFKDKILEFASKIPVIGDMITKEAANQESN